MTLKQRVARFIAERCHKLPGSKTPLSRFTDEFLLGYLPAAEREQTGRREVIEALDAMGIERGQATSNQMMLANIAMPSFRYAVRDDGRLIRAPL